MHTIELILIGRTWMTKNSDPEVKRLFGTDMLPTPFTEYANRNEVMKTIQGLNPDMLVYFQ